MYINAGNDSSKVIEINANVGRDGSKTIKLNADIVRNKGNNRETEIDTKDPNPKTKNTRRDLGVIIYLALILICSFILGVREDYTYLPMFGFDYKISLICPFEFFTGHDCPFCGMTRCFVSLSHLDFASAVRFNMAGILAYALCVLEIIYRAVKILSQKHQSIIKAMGHMRTLLFILMIAVAVVDWVITF